MKIEKTAARLLGALLMLSVVSMAVTACGRKPSPAKGGAAAAPADARAVTVVPIESRPLEGGLTASGLLLSREEAAVSSDLSGYRVARVNVEQGAWVRAGQPLIELDDSLLRAQIQQAEAQAAQADSQAKRVTGLDSAGVLSEEQIETRRFQAKVQDAALAELRTREAHMVIRAPVSGLVLERNVRPGDIASAGGSTPMFRMIRDGLVELNAEVPEGEFASIRIGDPVKVSLPDGKDVQGSVRLIDPQVDAQTKLGHVRVQLPVRSDLRPGGFGRATFIGASNASLTVPELAVRYDADGASVMVVGPDNRVHEAPVKTGRRSGGYVELLQGPPAGSRVLLRAASFVLPGDVVKPIDAPPGAAASGKGG